MAYCLSPEGGQQNASVTIGSNWGFSVTELYTNTQPNECNQLDVPAALLFALFSKTIAASRVNRDPIFRSTDLTDRNVMMIQRR